MSPVDNKKVEIEDEEIKNYYDFKCLSIDKNNLESKQVRDLLHECIDKCDYVAVDCEFLASRFHSFKKRPTKELYEENLEMWRSASLLQLGLTFFKYEKDEKSPENLKLISNSFSLIVIPEHDENGDATWAVEVSCMVFMYEHNFDFKNYFKNAIPYLPCPQEPSSKNEKSHEFTVKSIFNLLHEKQKTFVVHRGFSDLLFIYSCFVDRLPSTYEEFKKSAHKFYNRIFDTKLLTLDIENNSLGKVYKVLSEEHSSKVAISSLVENSTTDSELKPHDAAYDSFMTAVVFALKVSYSSENFKLEEYENIIRATNGEMYVCLKEESDVCSDKYWDNLDQFK
ncbi:MAG: Target of EGR1, member 1 (Nuclear) [Marteilia pararefringens]